MLLGGLIALLLAAPREADVRDALERVRAAERYQTELPGAPAPATAPPMTPPDWEDVGSAPPHGRPGERDPSDIRPAGNTIFWLMVVALGIAAALWVAREVQLKMRARGAIAGAGTAAPAPVTASPAAPLLPHEALARQGRFAEAIHAILAGVLGAIGRAHAGLQPSWTSREILGLVKLEEGAQRALASLVRMVEVTRFGGAPAGADEYRAALGWLEVLRPRRAA